ncbi:DUF6845 domain-containing protein [Phocaeicola vulgatus]|jgi:hypothetical protein|uniref:DUF3829 domain-containing protein n=1 Tax=Phocaeicola vulgatus TaxID=821 RepID=A0A412QUW1_PHOVU|nr:hypothetical protein [Phocaeicola vulgatus]MCG0153891.1 hypothetical protein [Phocaeicola vulgatus]MCG0327673.1 hypothetical protein [Phocaeicola vulgatus]MCG0331543.1 hypothetical protein [Phocaeicola vulgatus]RGT94771.1 hypothetical protein DWX04_08370 [Phocaeicola vulgatus]
MKKNLLLYGVFLCALSISSCSGGSKSNHVMDSSSMSVENANEVMKYYDTSLKILKDLVNENEIKAVLGYLDQKMPVDSLPVVSQPVVSVQDTVFVSNPGNYFSENDRQNLKENYGRLFRSISAFYENYKTYRLYMQDQSYKKDNNALADKIRKEELLLSIALSEYKQVIFDILTPIVEGAKITLTPIKGNVKDK